MLRTDKGGLEEGLGAAETLIANGDDLTVRQFIAFLQRGGGGCGCHLILKVQSNVTKFLLDVTHNLTFSYKQRAKVIIQAAAE